jgi:ribose-phosphate pyrophosphokinase
MHLKLDDLILNIEEDKIISEYNSFTFSGGEEHIKINSKLFTDDVMIEVCLDSSKKVMLLLLATDAIKRLGVKNIYLCSPYIPYCRQDRVCRDGEALSLKVITNIINNQKYAGVYTLHDHSIVTPALIDNHIEINLLKILEELFKDRLKPEQLYLISADAGALKTANKINEKFKFKDIITCNKTRSSIDGSISSLEISRKDFKEEDCIIIDDICDGGRTFIEIAKKLKTKNCGKIILYVSHGIFSRGLDVFEGLIDEIITTNSFFRKQDDKLKTILLKKEMLNV